MLSPRPQTTRNRIQGIVNRPNAQVVLIDTPGLHRPESALGRQMMGEVDAAIDAVDIVALLLDASEKFGQGDRRAVERASVLKASVSCCSTRSTAFQKPSCSDD